MTFDSGDVARVTAKMELRGDDVQNTYHVRNNGAGPQTYAQACADIAARLDLAYQQVYAELVDDLVFTTIEVFNITKDEPMGEVGWPTLVTGLGTGDILPGQVAGLVKFTTLVARSQGRKYISGWGELANDNDGDPSSTVLTVLASYATTLLTTWVIGGGVYEFGNWSKLYARFAQWVSPIVRQVWRTQRRRARLSGS